MILEELLIKVGVKSDLKGLDKINKSLKDLPKIAGMVGVAVSGAVAGLTAFVSKTLGALDAVHQLANVTAVSVDDIYLLGKVAEVNGSSIDAAQNSIKGLSRVIGEASNGIGLGARAFEHFGMSAKNADGSVKTTMQVLGEIQDKMQTLSEAEQISLLAKMGIDESFIQTLRLSKTELAEAMDRANALTLGVGNAENARLSAQFQDSLTELFQLTKGIGEYLAIKLAPALSRIIDYVKDWYMSNNDLVKRGLNFIASILGGIVDVAQAFIRVIDELIIGSLGWENTLGLLVTGLLAVKRAMIAAFVTNPVTWIIGAITALVLLVDDFITYLKGGESALGDFWKPFAKALIAIKPVIKQVKEALINLFNSAKPYIRALVQDFKRMIAVVIDIFSALISAIQGDWSGAIAHLKRAFSNWYSWISSKFNSLKAFTGNVIKAIGNLFADVFDYISKPFIRAFDWVQNKWDQFISYFTLDNLKALLSSAYDLVSKPFLSAFEFIKNAWNTFLSYFNLDPLFNLFSTVRGNLLKPFADVFDWIKSLWGELSNSFDPGKIWDMIASPFEKAFAYIKKKYDEYIAPLFDSINSISDYLFGTGKNKKDKKEKQDNKKSISKRDADLNNMRQQMSQKRQQQAPKKESHLIKNVSAMGKAVAPKIKNAVNAVKSASSKASIAHVPVNNTTNNNTTNNIENKSNVNVHLTSTGITEADARRIANESARAVRNAQSMALI